MSGNDVSKGELIVDFTGAPCCLSDRNGSACFCAPGQMQTPDPVDLSETDSFPEDDWTLNEEIKLKFLR